MKCLKVLSVALILCLFLERGSAETKSPAANYIPVRLLTTLGGYVRPEAFEYFSSSHTLFLVTLRDNSTCVLTVEDLNFLYAALQQNQLQFLQSFFSVKRSHSKTDAVAFDVYYFKMVRQTPAGRNLLARNLQAPVALRDVPGVSVTSQTNSGPVIEGTIVRFTNVVSNLGDRKDLFNITTGADNFPLSTTFLFLQDNGEDGAIPLLDNNNDNIPDTGFLAPRTSRAIIVIAILPMSATGGPFTVQIRATSLLSPAGRPWEAIYGTGADLVNSIIEMPVDLTSKGPLPSGEGAAGMDVGNVYPSVQLTAHLADTIRFTNYVNNVGPFADSYGLGLWVFQHNSPYTYLTNWTVEFHDENNNTIVSTGLMESGSSKLVYADVTVPSDLQLGTLTGREPIDLFFQVLSVETDANDFLYDQVIVETNQ